MPNAGSYRRAFWSAVAIIFLLWLIPFGGLLLYPFSLVATWAHEIGHGLTALLVGGSFTKLQLHFNLGGLAVTRVPGTVRPAIIAAGGLVGAPLVGTAVVAFSTSERAARRWLFGLAATIALSGALWVRNLFGIVAVVALVCGLVYTGWRVRPRRRFVVVQLLGIELALSALSQWDYLFMADTKVDGRIIPSDVSAIAQALGGHYILWGILIAALNMAILYGAYRLARQRLAQQS